MSGTLKSSRLLLASAALAGSLAVASSGQAANGVVQYEIPFTHTTPYIDCLGEAVDLEFTVTVRLQYIELQNGNVHYVEHWFLDGTGVGVDSGLTWYGRGTSPYELNASGDGMANPLVVKVRYEALDGARDFMEKQRIRFVVDDNGLVRVDYSEPLQYQCLGK